MAPSYRWFLAFALVCWLPLMLAGAEEQQGAVCSGSAKRCGNFTISDPFWLADNEAGSLSCGSLDFEVTCDNNNTPILRSPIPFGHGYQFISISYEKHSMHVVDQGKLQLLPASNGCQAQILNTTSKLSRPFRIDPSNLNLIMYNCTEEGAAVAAARRDRELVQTRMRCQDERKMFVRAGVRYNAAGDYAGYAMEGCDALVMPVMGSSGKANASNYEQLIRDGFILTWELPPGRDLSRFEGTPSIQVFTKVWYT